MKKFLVILAVLAMMLNLTVAAMAEGGESALDVKLADVINQDAAGEAVEGAAGVADGYEVIDAPKSGMERAGGASDSVVINGNNYSVITPHGIEILYNVPSGRNVFCLTQDYVAQHELYEAFYNSPIATVQNFIESDMHFNIFDADSGVDIYIYIGEANWAALYPNSTQMTASDADDLLELMRQGLSVFGSALDTQVGWLGGNVYFYANCYNNGAVHLLTAVNGYEVYVRYNANTNDAVDVGLDLLANLTIRAR